MASLHVRLERLNKALNNVVEAADEAIAACYAVPVPEDDPTLLDLVEFRERLAGQADASSDIVAPPTNDGASPIPPLYQAQSSSKFLNLPAEIRNQVYEYFFSSTRLLSGKRRVLRGRRKRMKPAPSSLAILHTCRQVHHEASAIWLGQVLFSFENPEDMLNKLSALPKATVAQIRRVRVGGRPFRVWPVDNEWDLQYRLAWCLELLPGLRLDKLTVLGSRHENTAWDTLKRLMEYKDGWRVLEFIAPNSRMLGTAHIGPFMKKPLPHTPRPKTLNETMLDRDGEESGASATVYRATQRDTPGAVMKHQTRQLVQQRLPPKDQEGIYWEENRGLMSENEVTKELLVIVERGRDVDITQRNPSRRPIGQDTRHWAYGRTWEEVRSRRFENFSDEDEELSAEEDEDVEFDAYTDVDDYSWDNVF